MSRNFLVVTILLLIILLGGILVFSIFINKENGSPIPNQQVQNNSTTTPVLPDEDICTNNQEILTWPEDTNTIADDFPQKIGSPEILLGYVNKCPNNPEIIKKIAIPDLDAKYNQETGRYSFVKKSDNSVKIVKWNQEADFDKDGKNEIVASVIDAFNPYPYGGVGYFQSLVIFKKKGLSWKIDYQETNEAGGYKFNSIEDMNGDGKPELVISASGSGATTGYINTKVLERSEGKWVNIGELTTTSPNNPDGIKIQDIDGDGIKEILSYGGSVASAGAGNKQRSATFIFKYNPTTKKYDFSEKIYDPIEDNYFRMLDAYYALKKNNIDEAQQILSAAIQKPRWQIFSNKFGIEAEEKSPEEYVNNRIAQKINAYIINELMLTYTAKSPDSLSVIEGLLNQMISQFAQLQSTSSVPYIEGAKALKDSFAATKDYKQACQAMENKIASYGSTAEFFDWYGYNEEHLKPEETCPF